MFHPHKPGDLVLLDDPAQKMNKLAPRWKGPFVIVKCMGKDGHPGVTYEITDPRKTHSRTWIVHHNRLKSYQGTLQNIPDVTLSTGLDHTPSAAPPVTALSGALPFRPPTPPFVPARPGQPTPSPVVEAAPQSAPPSPPPSPIVSNRSVSPFAHPVVSRSGHRICRPHKYRDFVRTAHFSILVLCACCLL